MSADYEQQLVNEYRASAPAGAKHVVFIGDSDRCRRYPAHGGWSLWTGGAPPLPNGRYLILYYDENGSHLKTIEQRHIQVRRPNPQPGSSMVRSNPSAGTGAALASAPSERVPLLPEHQRELSAVEVSLRAAEAEFKKHRMAVAMQRDGQKLARSARQTKELHEAAALNNTYRLEMAALAETHSNITRRHVEHSAKMMENLGTVSETVGTVMANLQKAAQTIAHPPPPPVDYSDAILKTVGMLGGMVLNGIAMMKGLPPPDKGSPEKTDADFAGTVDAGLVDKNQREQPPAAKEEPAQEAGKAPAPRPSAPSQPSQPDPAPSPAHSPAAPAAAESNAPSTAASMPSEALRVPDMLDTEAKEAMHSLDLVDPEPSESPHIHDTLDSETATSAPDDRSELDALIREFAQETQDHERGLPVPEVAEEDAGVAYFMTPDRTEELNQLARFLRKFPSRTELEQLITISAPHLMKEPE